MGVHSGKFAIVNGKSTMRGWTITHRSTNQPSVASNTRGGTFRLPGIRDWTGQVRLYGGMPAAMPNDVFTFTGFTAPDNDIGANPMTGEIYSGSCMVEQVVIRWNWASADPVNHEISFGANGALTLSDASQATDATAPQMAVLCGLHPTFIDVTGGSAAAQIPNVTDITLTIKAAVKPFVNSTTNNDTFRKAGPIDFTLAVRVQDNLRVMAIDDVCEFILPIDGSRQFDIKWARVEEFSGLEVNRETGDIIAQTINASMAGYDFQNSALGSITLPDSTVWWPIAG